MAGFVGIDIGKTHVRAASLSVGYKRLSLARLEEVALDASTSLESALQQVFAPLREHSDGLAVAIDGDQAFIHRISIPAAAHKRLEEVLPFEVEANVPGAEAGFVHPGANVQVKFDTFPYTQYGMAQGTVRLVSADSFTSDPGQAQRGASSSQEMVPGKSNPAFYRARVSIDSVGLHDVPYNFRVVPGMPVTADVKVGKRTVLSYMLGRVLPVWLDSMREP